MNESILLYRSSLLSEFSKKFPDLKREVTVIIPALNIDLAIRCATQLQARAQFDDVTYIVVQDDSQLGFISVVNKIAKLNCSEYIVYTAEDAFPGIGWLKLSFETLKRSGKGLLPFNDGKWFGRIAAFGMVRLAWATKNYESRNVFYEQYSRHFADAELSLIAQKAGEYIYNPDALLIEVDYQKKLRWKSDSRDQKLFNERKDIFSRKT